MADDMSTFIKETYWDMEDYFLFGHGIGGLVATEMAIKYPYKIKGVFLLGLKVPNTGN